MAVVKEIVQKEDTVDANQRKMAKKYIEKKLKDGYVCIMWTRLCAKYKSIVRSK
jgi:hypothetical protein